MDFKYLTLTLKITNCCTNIDCYDSENEDNLNIHRNIHQEIRDIHKTNSKKIWIAETLHTENTVI